MGLFYLFSNRHTALDKTAAVFCLQKVQTLIKDQALSNNPETLHAKKHEEKQKINEELFVPIFNVITALNIYVIWCSIWHQYGTVLVFWELRLLQLRIPCGILTLPLQYM